MMSDQGGQRRIFLASFLTLIAAGVGFIIRNKLLDDWASSFGFTKFELGLITGAGLWGFPVTIIVCSIFADRIGYKVLLILAFLLHVSSAVVTLSADWVFLSMGKDATYQCLYWGSFLFALGNGACESAINPLVATLYPKQKTHYLNILHAGWPGGLVVGAILAVLFCGKDAQISHLDWKIPMAFFLVPTAVYGFITLKEHFPSSETKASGVTFGEMLAHFVYPMLIFLLLLHACVGYVELGTDSWITNILDNYIPQQSLALFIWASSIMFVLRFFAGPIVHRINPLGLLCLSGVIGCIGLYLLGSTKELVPIAVAYTIYALGKTFLWPTMLGVAGERFPRGGALVMGAMGGVGMLSAGLLGGPGIGYKQDYYASKQLQESSPKTYERYAAEKPNHFLFLPAITGLDGAKVGVLQDQGEDLAKRVQRAKETGKDEDAAKLATWWETALPHADEDKTPLKDAGIFGGQMALKLTAIVPATMAVCYLLLVFYFIAQGGYKALHVEEEPEGPAEY